MPDQRLTSLLEEAAHQFGAVHAQTHDAVTAGALAGGYLHGVYCAVTSLLGLYGLGPQGGGSCDTFSSSPCALNNTTDLAMQVRFLDPRSVHGITRCRFSSDILITRSST